MPDGQEETVDGKVEAFLLLSAHVTHQMCAFHSTFAIESHGVGVIKDFDVLPLTHTFLHRRRSAQIVFAHNHIDLAGQFAQVMGFFTGCVATANDGHHTLAVEKSVASGTGRHTHSGIFFLIVKPQILGAGTCSHNHGLCLNGFATIESGNKRSVTQINALDDVAAHHSTQIQGLLSHGVHQFIGINPIGEPWKILNRGGLCELASGL